MDSPYPEFGDGGRAKKAGGACSPCRDGPRRAAVPLLVDGVSPTEAAAARIVLGPLRDAGATWWDERTPIGQLDKIDPLRRRIGQGPPRLDNLTVRPGEPSESQTLAARSHRRTTTDRPKVDDQRQRRPRTGLGRAWGPTDQKGQGLRPPLPARDCSPHQPTQAANPSRIAPA